MSETMKVRWDPDQYRRFASHRLRPALDLIARLEGLEPKTVYDLGCGTGEITRLLATLWPDAHVCGIDSSEEMLARARGPAGASVTFERGDLASWEPKAPVDVLFSNAAYHWIPDHRNVFPNLVRSLAPGGALAVQMPMSWDLPSHRAMRDVLDQGRDGKPFGTPELRAAMARKPLLGTAEYYGILAVRATEIDLWETEYFQTLDGEDAVLEWVRGTGLRPILDGLEGEEREAFLERYRWRLRELYPRRSDGRTLYPFRRLFMFCRVPSQPGR
jgi:trans-aconitate 2-methyltransferase